MLYWGKWPDTLAKEELDMVLDQMPSRVGQRVQEVFSDTRGWVVDLGGDRAKVEWDEPNDLDEDVFPIDALRVVEVIRIDADHFEDPAMHPLVEVSYTPEDGITNFVVNTPTLGQRTIRDVNEMRAYLIGYHTSA